MSNCTPSTTPLDQRYEIKNLSNKQNIFFFFFFRFFFPRCTVINDIAKCKISWPFSSLLSLSVSPRNNRLLTRTCRAYRYYSMIHIARVDILIARTKVSMPRRTPPFPINQPLLATIGDRKRTDIKHVNNARKPYKINE